MRAVDLIRRKRDAGELTREEIEQFIAAYTAGDIPDYQMSAWLMAVVLRGMSRPEIAALTEAMLHSGSVLDFPISLKARWTNIRPGEWVTKLPW
jgi:thymidine phosphorylase